MVLIDPWESSRKLIQHATAVTTLTGSAGFEAMLLRKMVIISGNVFYENAPGVVKVNDIYLRYCDIIKHWKKPDRSEIIKYLCEYFRCLWSGNISNIDKNTYKNENVDRIAEALYIQMNRILNVDFGS